REAGSRMLRYPDKAQLGNAAADIVGCQVTLCGTGPGSRAYRVMKLGQIASATEPRSLPRCSGSEILKSISMKGIGFICDSGRTRRARVCPSDCCPRVQSEAPGI